MKQNTQFCFSMKETVMFTYYIIISLQLGLKKNLKNAFSIISMCCFGKTLILVEW